MATDATLSAVSSQREASPLQALVGSQAFWVTVAVLVISLGMSMISESFGTYDNFFNITRNFAFIGIIALGQTAVIITAGIDLSVGSVMGLAGIVTGLVLSAGEPMWLGMAAGLMTALACGLVNGGLIAYLNLSPFVVTLGMLSIARSLALVVSNNQMFYEFGPDEEAFLALGGGQSFGIAHPVLILVLLTLVIGFLFRFTVWGRHVYAVGGNEQAARLTGVPVKRVKLSVYVLSSLMAGLSAILIVGWLGSVTNALGLTYELRVIASTVIGGANLMGGVGTAYGAFIGSALIEVIRNSLLLAGVDPYWQGTFVGLFIILAVLLGRAKAKRGT
ncbi:MAG: ABC transporter permease [Kiloniellales bacterium]|nr:ABC transporter permease [Kiloniellales bacterium]